MTDQHTQYDTGEGDIGRLLRQAYGTSVDIETASRHLWRLHRVAAAPQVRGVRRTLVSAVAAVLLFATAGAAVALSTSAVPGDSLYSVKRGAERVHLMVSFAPDADARLHLRFARSRVDEARTVAASHPDAVPDLLSELVAAVDRAVAVGGSDLDEEVDIVRLEASSALASLGEELDGELAASIDDTVRALGGAAVATRVPPEGGQPGEGDPEAGPAHGDPDGAAPAGTDGSSSEGVAGRLPAPGGTVEPPSGRAQTDAVGDGTTDDATAGGDTGRVQDEATLDGTAEAGAPETDDGEARTATGATGSDADDAPAGPASSPAAPEPDTAEVAADSTMPTLERLEGLLRHP